jgi:hypothetical protein
MAHKKRNLAREQRLLKSHRIYAPSISHPTDHIEIIGTVERQYSTNYDFQVKPWAMLDGNNHPTMISVAGQSSEWLNDSANDLSYLQVNLTNNVQPFSFFYPRYESLEINSGKTTGVENFIARTEYQVIEEWNIRTDGGTSAQVTLNGDTSISERAGSVDSDFLSLQDSDYINDLTFDSNVGGQVLYSGEDIVRGGSHMIFLNDGRTTKQNQDLPFNVIDSDYEIASYANNEYAVPRQWYDELKTTVDNIDEDYVLRELYDSAVANGGGGIIEREAWS